MSRYLYVVQSSPVAGREDEYNDWYTNVHLADVLKVNGFMSAQRFRFRPADGPHTPQHRYLALYDVETDDLQATEDHNQYLATETSEMPMTDAFDMSTFTRCYFEPITDRRERPV
jgi:hypothetical protein